MNAYKTLAFTAITLTALLVSLLPRYTVFAWPNLTDGVVSGENADYQITVPEGVRRLVSLEKAAVDESAIPTMIEGIEFYYQSSSPSVRRVLILRLSVYDKSAWVRADEGSHVVTISRDYVFVAQFFDNKGFMQAQDRAYYDYCKTYLGKTDTVKNLISLSSYQKNLYDDTVFVKGEVLTERAVLLNNIHYVPLRPVFESLGFIVGWNRYRSSVEILGNGMHDFFILTNGRYNGKGFQIIIINDRSYIATAYFLRYMNESVAIDEANNVYIG